MSTSQSNLNAVFNDIATAINNKGVSGTMTPVQMADKIASISSGGGGSGVSVTERTADITITNNVTVTEEVIT